MDTTPKTIGIMMDGNRRWARERNMSVHEGHREGMKKLLDCVAWAKDAGVQYLIVYAFSTENWRRSEEEVSDLKEVALEFTRVYTHVAKKEKVRVQVIGQRNRLSDTLREKFAYMERETDTDEAELTLVVAASYGGRAEIVEAVKNMSEEERGALTEETFGEKLWTAGIPDPDLIIRTGGQKRLSNFLLWQSAYSELFFIDTYWPAFTKEEFDDILHAYGKRQQNRGK